MASIIPVMGCSPSRLGGFKVGDGGVDGEWGNKGEGESLSGPNTTWGLLV